ncbi:(deoxy)nucleoside triphosphate pyrophosphohydrolase [Anatilimnocola floriformis]|uniref:(deoxy)nucleoside triphosphate pyrophosphohydrolase n=1 Tax=Anatilimnocola floriformis TaxID=2948575 RepID=UPI0020C5A203|nr:(deoxy)nucleoside triphosphate pyrophosphohydrolase [Anatilimnocola floriformis]
MPEPKLIQIAIAVVARAGSFLIGQRPEGVALAGLWEFPGGKMNAGETPEAATIRECLEETGLAVRAVSHYPECVQEYPHATVHLHFIACEPIDPSAPLLPPFRWVPAGELAHYEFPEGNRTLLKLLTAT